MEITLQEAGQKCQHLLCQGVQQLIQESGQDPLANCSLEKLTAVVSWLDRVKGKLEEESGIFSRNHEIGQYSNAKLDILLPQVREASRMLSIALLTEPARFLNKRKGDVDMIKALEPYSDPALMEGLDLQTIAIAMRPIVGTTPTPTSAECSDEEKAESTCSSQHSGRPRLVQTVRLSNDFTRGATAVETMQTLAKHFSELAAKFEDLHKRQTTHVQEKTQKEELKRKIAAALKDIVPMLRDHVLRVGITKCQLLLPDNPATAAAAIAKLFDYATVNVAHRQLEEARDRLLQELTWRHLQEKLNGDMRGNKRRKMDDS
eukprot:TRINITY_DN20499_c0_g1_i2.p1 TRINITY_DN20499_c0_g1~~TRINITY_DN20499_c0_g1_i2.p1  ORF type:complete len:318 (-),score=61.51 TRINITY_DN20499_c0_g1_i2:385-1338(-)